MQCKNCGKEIDRNKKGFGFKHGHLFCSKNCLNEFEKKHNLPHSEECEFC